MSFVGSTPIARYIYETGTKAGKRVQALGGAKNHMIVLPDADIDMAADAAVSAGYGSAGERCMAIATIVAVGDVADPLVEAIKARLPKVKVGPGSDPTSEMGPLVTKQHRDKVASYLDSGPAQGATVVADGREHPLYDESDGFFLGVVADRQRDARRWTRYRDEIFGPVLTVMRVKTYEEAVSARQRQPVRQRHGDLHPRRRRGAPVPVRGRTRAWSASTCRSRCRSRTTASAAGRTSLFGDLHMYGPEGVQFYTRGQDRHLALAGSRARRKVDLGFPRTGRPGRRDRRLIHGCNRFAAFVAPGGHARRATLGVKLPRRTSHD